jgi:hypothetical protein
MRHRQTSLYMLIYLVLFWVPRMKYTQRVVRKTKRTGLRLVGEQREVKHLGQATGGILPNGVALVERR